MIILPIIKKHKRKISGADWFLIIAILLVMVFSLIYFSWPPLADWFASVGPELHEFALKHGYVGGFMITLISNLSVIVIIPYGSVLFLLGSVGLNPWLLGFTAALAATLGEIVGYGIGWGARGLIRKEKHVKRFERIKEVISRRPRLTPFLIYLFGATPIPDDIIMIPLGLIRYPFWKAIIPDALGKLTMILVVVLSGRYSYNYINQMLGSESGFWIGIITVILTIMFIYLTIKVKWDKLIK